MKNNGSTKTYDYLLDEIKKQGAVALCLIDPDEQSPERAAEIAQIAKDAGAAGVLVGGSGTDFEATESCVSAIKGKVDIPTILFPGNITGLAKGADAIFFMSLLNSRSNYWLSLAQAMAAASLKKLGLEIIPMGYMIIESGQKTSVEFYGDANAIPKRKPKIAAAFALAAQFMGMRIVYLEAGSGALEPVSNRMIQTVKSSVDIPVIIGGGIKTGETAYEKAKAGADIIVVGTVIEKSVNASEVISSIVNGVKKAGAEKLAKATA
jgi:phosphoglycerol geranylgeranyltransferase